MNFVNPSCLVSAHSSLIYSSSKRDRIQICRFSGYELFMMSRHSARWPVCAGLGHQRSLQEETRSISTSGPPGPPQQGPKYSGLREAAQVTMTSSGETKVYVYVIRLLSNARRHLESLNILTR